MLKRVLHIALVGVLAALLASDLSTTTAQGPTSGGPLPIELQRIAQERVSLPPGMPAASGSAGGIGTRGVIARIGSTAHAQNQSAREFVPTQHQMSPALYDAAKRAAAQAVGSATGTVLNNDPARGIRQPSSPRAPLFYGISYHATNFTNWIPPDPNAVPTQSDVLAVVNSNYYVFDKSASGQILQSGDFRTLYSSLFPGGTSGVLFYDPRVVYQYDVNVSNERVYMVVLAVKSSTLQSWIMVSASTQNDAKGGFINYRFDATLDGTTPTSNWADFPSIGLDGTNLYVSTNQFGFSDNLFKYAKVRILKLAELQSGTITSGYWDFTNIQNADHSLAFTVAPASHYFTSSPVYLVSSENNLSANSGNHVSLFRIDVGSNNWTGGSSTNAPSLVRVNTMATAHVFSNPPNAQQRESSMLIDTGDDRILSARRYTSNIWVMLTTSRPDGYAGVSVFTISTAGNILWENAGWGATGCYYFNPSIAIDDRGNIAIDFSRSCTNEYVGIAYTGMKLGANALEASALVKAGEAPYVNVDQNGQNRWGDYSGIERDPTNSLTFWIFNEYATTPVGSIDPGRWATWMYTAWYPTFAVNLPLVVRGN